MSNIDGGITQAIILVGGQGTRLGALSQEIPKPLLPVDGRPFVEYLLDALATNGVSDIILSCGHLGEQLAARYDGVYWHNAHLRCVMEKSPAGTGGTLALWRSLLASRFFMVNGDSILTMDFAALTQALGDDETQRLGALALAPRPPGESRYGAVAVDASGVVHGFKEKNANGKWINGGVYAFHRSVAAKIVAPCSLEQDILPPLAARGLLGGLRCQGDFIDIGVPADFARAQKEVPRIARLLNNS